MTQTQTIPTTFMGYKANNDRGLTSISELLEEHDMSYGVEKVPATYNWQGDTRTADNEFHLVRSDNGQCLSGQTVTKTYSILTPGDIADDFQWFVDSGYASPFSAFRTSNGVECVALLLNTDLFPGVNGYSGFILGQNRQGQAGAKGSLFVWRQICSNGMMGWGKEGSFSIAHRGEVRQKFTDHTREWARIEETFLKMNERMTELSGIPMTFQEFERATNELHGIRQDGTELFDAKTGKALSTRKRNIREEILAAVNMPAMGTYGRSAADFYNAVTYRLSHTREGSQRSQTALTDSLITGASRAEESRALNILAELSV